MMASPQALRCAARVGLATLLSLGALLPAHAANDRCSFRSRLLAIRLPDIRPEQGADIQATSTTVQFGDCVPATRVQVRLDNGQHAANGRRRMKHATQEAYLPYTLSPVQPGDGSSLLPEPVRGPGRDRYISQTLRLHIQGSALADLPAGDYSDSITLTVTP